MTHRSALLCFCIFLMQLLQFSNGYPPPPALDPEVRAHLEAKVIESMSLKDLEEMVENDERVRNAPSSKFIIIPKPKSNGGRYESEDLDEKAYIIHRKTKKYPKKAISDRISMVEREFDDGFRRSSFEPKFKFESAFKYDEEFPSLFGVSDFETSASDPVKSFFESIAERISDESKSHLIRDPISLLEMAASQNAPLYRPRFDYDSYSTDSTEKKLAGKPYWKDAPERREEHIDENGCRTIVKKIMDPEDEKKPGAKAKSVIITKECETPNIEGPDAKIAAMQSSFEKKASGFRPLTSSLFKKDESAYERSRPSELDMDTAKSSDPLQPGYIDKMLDTHFKSFSSFNNPITSFKGYQDRFKLQAPEAFKDIKPTVNVQSYDYSHPQSGFESESGKGYSDEQKSPIAYERHVNYDYPPQSAIEKNTPEFKASYPKVQEHHYHYDYPKKYGGKVTESEYDGDKAAYDDGKYAEKKDPKMMKKSFAYYRKDNPKEDPNDQQYAEEYAQGNYRSFSSDYDSERDGPKKS